MKPLRLRATNFRTFPSLDLELHAGLVGILGEFRDAPDGADSNGAGKSSILEAIDICLFGRRSLSGFLTRGGDVTELMLELTFEHAGEAYRVRRNYSARTKAGKTTCDFEYWKGEPLHSGDDTGPQWEPLTRSSTKETDQLIIETVGLTRDTFRNSSYLRQGDGSYADPARDPKQRKDLLVEAALGRDPVWPRLQEAARIAKRTTQSELERSAGETRAARELVDGKPVVEADHRKHVDAETTAAAHLADTEAVLQATSERYLAAKDGAARRATVEAEISAGRATLEQLQRLDVAATEAVIAIGVACDELETLPTGTGTEQLVARERELVAAIATHETALTAHRRTTEQAQFAEHQRAKLLERVDEQNASANAVRARITALSEKTDATCDLCGQAVHDDAKAKMLAEYDANATAFDAKATALRSEALEISIPTVAPAPEGEPPTVELAGVRAQLAAAQQQVQQRARLEERITGLQRDVAARPAPEVLQTAAAAVTAKQAELADIEPVNLASIEAAGVQARASVASARTALDVVKVNRARLDERLATIAKAEAQLAAATVLEEALQGDVDVETIVERACGRDGIPALIIENQAIPYIEAEANRILGADGLKTGMRIELRTQQALKDGTGLRDTLEVVVIDRNGNEADFQDGISGGQQTRVSLALRIALARLLANRRGAESRLLALDEPTALDASGMRALLEVLNGLQSEFDLILLVSHVPELRDSLEQWLLVINEGGDHSRIEGARVLESVEETVVAA